MPYHESFHTTHVIIPLWLAHTRTCRDILYSTQPPYRIPYYIIPYIASHLPYHTISCRSTQHAAWHRIHHQHTMPYTICSVNTVIPRHIYHSFTYFAYNAIQQQQTCHVPLYVLHAIPQSTTRNVVPYHAIACRPTQPIPFLTIPYHCRSYHAIPLHNIGYLDFSLHTISNWRVLKIPISGLCRLVKYYNLPRYYHESIMQFHFHMSVFPYNILQYIHYIF